MKEKEQKDYYIGFDIGTDSVGWAVTDTNYHLLRAKGKDLWGVHLFDAAQTAEGRRGYRSTRRRLARRKYRLKLLQELFAPEISKVDPSFYQRLEDSKYYPEDKHTASRYTLFSENGLTDKSFYKQWPTMFHLRRDLYHGEAKAFSDIRFLYLAIAHIIKYRGNFLFEGKSFSINDDTCIKTLLEYKFLDGKIFDHIELQTFKNILLDKSKSCKDKEKQLKTVFQLKTDQQKAIMKAILGFKTNVSQLFNDETVKEKAMNTDIKNSFSFADTNYDQNIEPILLEICNTEQIDFLHVLKQVYDWNVLQNIINGSNSISESMCKLYQQHHEDLEYIKTYIRLLKDKKLYDRIFSEKLKDNVHNYASYVKHYDTSCATFNCHKTTKKEDFYAFLKKELNALPDSEQKQYIMTRIENNDFLPRQVSSDNGVIPYQLHLLELEQILNHAIKYFPFLNNVTDGYTVAQKIIMLLTFRIPYYVGPLNDQDTKQGKGFAWIKKEKGTEHLAITPWNFLKIVDTNASEEEFIQRMTNKCTYLVGEDVLPKASMLYQEFLVLNDLNNVRVNGEKLDDETKQKILPYFVTNKKISLKTFESLLKEYACFSQDTILITGVADFHHVMSTRYYFSQIFGEEISNPEITIMIENIVLWATIFSDATRLIERVKKQYPFLRTDQLQKIKGFNCSGWGTLSKKLLVGLPSKVHNEYGECLSIIEIMRHHTINFQEILHTYHFLDQIDQFNQTSMTDSHKIQYQDIEDLYCSPSVKRAIWRTILIAKELQSIMGYAPKRVFIEMAKGSDGSGEKSSRLRQLQDLYDSIDKDIAFGINIQSLKNELGEYTEGNKKEITDKIFLYFLQFGKCMYTMEDIDIENITNYDIDHIYPQSKTKDDSLDNRVLVTSAANRTLKQDQYPVPQSIRKKMEPFWKMLNTKEHNGQKFLSNEKLNRLTRCNPLTEDELADFINRQLVETRQSTKEAAKLLQKLYQEQYGADTEIVYCKASWVKDLMNTKGHKMYKIRELNDLHHAKDAYLNIVAGNVYTKKFGGNGQDYYKHQYKKDIESTKGEPYDLTRMFSYCNIPGAWDCQHSWSIVESTFYKNSCLVTKKLEYGKAQFYDQTIYRKSNDLIPLKGKKNNPLLNTAKYGGYNTASGLFFSLVKYKNYKNETILSLEHITTYDSQQYGTDKDSLATYYTMMLNQDIKDEKKKIKDLEVLIPKIYYNALLEQNGCPYRITGYFADRISLMLDNQLHIFKHDDYKFWHQLIANLGKTIGESPYNVLTKTTTLQWYHKLIAIMQQPAYDEFLNTYATQLAELETCHTFENLTVEEQCKVLYEMLHFVQCNRRMSDLSKIGMSKFTGSLSISKKFNIKDNKHYYILQSVTGVYEKRVSLNKLA